MGITEAADRCWGPALNHDTLRKAPLPIQQILTFWVGEGAGGRTVPFPCPSLPPAPGLSARERMRGKGRELAATDCPELRESGGEWSPLT